MDQRKVEVERIPKEHAVTEVCRTISVIYLTKSASMLNDGNFYPREVIDRVFFTTNTSGYGTGEYKNMSR